MKDVLANFCNDETFARLFFNSEVQNSESDREWLDDEQVEVLDELYETGITFELAEQFGGEGEGDSYWTVYKFTKGKETAYVKFNGWYQSYNGSEYDGDWFYVEPREVMVTQYFKV